MKDITRKTLKKGDFIVYAVSQGSMTPQLNFARFLSLEQRKTSYATKTRANIVSDSGHGGALIHSYIEPYERILVVKKSSLPKYARRLIKVNVDDPKLYPKAFLTVSIRKRSSSAKWQVK